MGLDRRAQQWNVLMYTPSAGNLKLVLMVTRLSAAKRRWLMLTSAIAAPGKLAQEADQHLPQRTRYLAAPALRLETEGDPVLLDREMALLPLRYFSKLDRAWTALEVVEIHIRRRSH
jgi:hypothetical protein